MTVVCNIDKLKQYFTDSLYRCTIYVTYTYMHVLNILHVVYFVYSFTLRCVQLVCLAFVLFTSYHTKHNYGENGWETLPSCYSKSETLGITDSSDSSNLAKRTT